MGLVFDLNPRWEHSAWEGIYEESVQQLFVKFSKPGTVVFDLGANYGFYAMLAAREGADVFAFEPDQENLASTLFQARFIRTLARLKLNRLMLVVRTEMRIHVTEDLRPWVLRT
jgi:hypothetical protein